MIVEPEKPAHYPAIRQLHIEAFPSPAEAGLVDQLRRDGDTTISLVAIEEGRVIGHIMFSKMRAPFKVLGLGPVSVVSDKRRQGIAAALIEQGLKRAKAEGWEAILVLGDPAYYQRFGFRADAAAA